MQTKSTIRFSGKIKLSIFKKGTLIEILEFPNHIVSTGVTQLARMMQGLTSITQIGFGSSGNPVFDSDDHLTDVFLKAVTNFSVTDNNLNINWNLYRNEANGLNIWELGLFTPDNILVARSVIQAPQAIPKDSDISLTGTWTIQISPNLES